MKKYFKSLNREVRHYLSILSPSFPRWLYDYIETPEVMSLDGISTSCGTCYTSLYQDKYNYSVLTHSIAVALIVWHFSHDREQTIAALLHDISTPAFKHCIDFLNGDSENQESTEEMTAEVIKNSKEIMALLKRDNIPFEAICNYHLYPIADNDMPQLSADRLEYTFAGGLAQVRIFTLSDINRFYNDLGILEDENSKPELGFMTPQLAEEFVCKISNLWPRWVEDEDRLCMQFIADVIKYLIYSGTIKVEDLYTLSEEEILNKIYSPNGNAYVRDAFTAFASASRSSVYKGSKPRPDTYCTNVKGKKRYINPLTINFGEYKRISTLSQPANKAIQDFLNMKFSDYVGFDFQFDP